MVDAVLHVGVGKTGSSSVQHHLTVHGSDRVVGTDFVYCAFDRTGEILSGRSLRERAKKTGVDYFSSFGPAPHSEEVIDRLRSGIKEVHGRGLIPVFSQEDWCHRGKEFAPVLGNLGLKVRIIIYVRPQVEFFNAGWWQWWAYAPQFKRPEDVIAAWNYGIFQWFAMAEAWSSIANVESVEVRLHGRDTVNDFLFLLGSPPVASVRKNVSLGPLALKLYRAVPGLRGVHDSHIDARLAPLLDDGNSAPWVTSPHLCANIITASRSGNIRLLDLMEDGQRKEMESNQKWWEPGSFSDKKLVSDEDLRLSMDDALEIIRRLVPMIRAIE